MTTSDVAALPPLNLQKYEAARATSCCRWCGTMSPGGSGDEVTLPANRAAFDRWRLLPRVLCGAREVSTATSVLGQDIALPVLVAPSGRHRLCHDEGERATARAAKAAGTIYTMSTAATLTIEEVAPEAEPWWFQIFIYRDRERSQEQVRRAAAAGASALVLTVDGTDARPTRGRRTHAFHHARRCANGAIGGTRYCAEIGRRAGLGGSEGGRSRLRSEHWLE
jgi:4-hydroxymandelate oxidase